MKVSLHIPEPLEGVPLLSWFSSVPPEAIFRHVGRPVFFEQEVERVGPESAAAILLPNNFTTLGPTAEAYIRQYVDIGDKFHIPVLVASFGDLTDGLKFDPRAYVLRLSVYRSTIGPHDIVVPTSVEDHGSKAVVLREKIQKPAVSFCGMAGFSSFSRWAKYYLKNVWWGVLFPARKIGVYWRRAAMRACENSTLVDTHFIIRRTFSGLRSTIELEPERARREFIESIQHADFVLTPKGDGNYSNRFLETLSFGRIPVVIDTEVVLPLEERIDYSKIMVRVPMGKVSQTPRYIREWYDALTPEEWKERQRLARMTFEDYLHQDAYLRHFFSEILPRFRT